jgi:hypothetical protein
MISALFVAKNGCYFGLPDVDPWDAERDARLYKGPWPVVAHPPCQLWTSFAHVNFKRWGGEHLRPGNDGGCFASALASVRKFGGVLEHPAFSGAWEKFRLLRPELGRWSRMNREWTCEVSQSAYGHRARKRTWLLYVGDNDPPTPRWDRPNGSHQIGYHDQRGKSRNKPTVSKREASATPIAFRDLLLLIAASARKPHA